MHTPATGGHDQHGKLGYFLVLSVLTHLLLALPPGQPLATPPLQLPAPELVLTTTTSHADALHAPRAAVVQTERAPPPAETVPPNPSRDSEPGAPTDAAVANHLRSLLHTALDQHFIYPAFARRNGWEGQVDVLVRLDQEGRLNAVRIVRSSGYSILDEDALLTLQRIGTIPEARSWLRGYSYDMQLPILYRLTES